MGITDYDLKRVIFDIIRMKLKIKDIKRLYRVVKVYTKISENKVRPKYLKGLKRGDIRMAVKCHNKYVIEGKGEKLDLKLVMGMINQSLVKLQSLEKKYPELSEAARLLVRKRLRRRVF